MDATFATALSSIIVSGIAAVGAISAQRSAARGAVANTQVSIEAKRLEEAYERARRFDIETIERQDREIDELRSIVIHRNERIDELEAQVYALKNQLELRGE